MSDVRRSVASSQWVTIGESGTAAEVAAGDKPSSVRMPAVAT